VVRLADLIEAGGSVGLQQAVVLGQALGRVVGDLLN